MGFTAAGSEQERALEARFDATLNADDLRTWLVEKTGQMTVPQIFAGDRSLGGYTDLAALDAKGQLDPLLRGDG